MTYFVTACAHMHRNLFQRRETAEVMVATIFRYRDAGEFQVHEYVVMPDHIHLLVTPCSGSSIARVMQLIKGGFSHELRQSGSRLNAVWQQRFQERRVRDLNDFGNFARYIRENPVRKGLASVACDYPYSSGAANVRLDEYPGLKPLTYKRAVDADLKVGSTVTSKRAVDADLKVSSTVTSKKAVDADLKVGSTVTSKRAVDADLKVGSTVTSKRAVDADLKVGSTVTSKKAVDADLKVGSTVVS